MLGNAAADHFPVFNDHRHPAFKTGDQPRHALSLIHIFFPAGQRLLLQRFIGKQTVDNLLDVYKRQA